MCIKANLLSLPVSMSRLLGYALRWNSEKRQLEMRMISWIFTDWLTIDEMVAFRSNPANFLTVDD
ncbi:MAG: hypothetical protein LAE24_11080 [Candidatus Contendobacter sp.]|nr:hypothetical protein [Candidatus Contendobacter sp.]